MKSGGELAEAMHHNFNHLVTIPQKWHLFPIKMTQDQLDHLHLSEAETASGAVVS